MSKIRVYDILVQDGFTQDQITECLRSVAESKSLTAGDIIYDIERLFVKNVAVICSNPFDISFKENYDIWRRLITKYYKEEGYPTAFNFSFLTKHLQLQSILTVKVKPAELVPQDRVIDVVETNELDLISFGVVEFDVLWFCGCRSVQYFQNHLKTIKNYIKPGTIVVFSETKSFVKTLGTGQFPLYKPSGTEEQKRDYNEIVSSLFTIKDNYPFLIAKYLQKFHF